jgi:phosphoserine aminotransferase
MSGIMSSVFGQRSTILAAVLGSRSYARLSIVNGKLELPSKTASKLLAIGQAEANLQDASLGRSHRAKAAKTGLKLGVELTREILQVPVDYRIGIVPGSDTGAVEMALWSLLGHCGVDVLAWESFGEGWVTDIVKQLKLKDVRILKAGVGWHFGVRHPIQCSQ